MAEAAKTRTEGAVKGGDGHFIFPLNDMCKAADGTMAGGHYDPGYGPKGK